MQVPLPPIHVRVLPCGDGGNAPTSPQSPCSRAHRDIPISPSPSQTTAAVLNPLPPLPSTMAWTDRRHLHLQHSRRCHLAPAECPVPSHHHTKSVVLPDSGGTTHVHHNHANIVNFHAHAWAYGNTRESNIGLQQVPSSSCC
ncbi:hypothetical protein LZ32DRAFT_610193 [Colletotrichum eremochloae]|nr:hypothetical protein LZ32DRAFT_610193 [Colletotrichum eremochloae]